MAGKSLTSAGQQDPVAVNNTDIIRVINNHHALSQRLDALEFKILAHRQDMDDWHATFSAEIDSMRSEFAKMMRKQE